ncbi:putative immunity protein [Demetria terragena]|uniref:putative immunity protein n=1 Tax=Demetria terragena TaxID=63959 RepID=UPI0012EA6576|nr:exonuclease SbcC [Demetria terragena]
MPCESHTPRVTLTLDELRAVSAFNLACALQVIDLFETAVPLDTRPREALAAAEAFVRGGQRSQAQRTCATAAHRAAKEASSPAARHAAMAAGDAAASAYLHPLADAAQVGHILRGPAHTVLALQCRPHDPLARADAESAALLGVPTTVADVLGRYPRVDAAKGEVTEVMRSLDERLREPARQAPLSPESDIANQR